MYRIICNGCNKEFQGQWWLCPSCGGSLVVEYTAPTKRAQFPLKSKLDSGLGEGKTPLVPLTNLSRQLGTNMWAKCEFVNPTGSFKDRGSVIEIAKAIELGKAGVVCASTGNMAASLAAYAARYGLSCTVVVPAQTPPSKLRQALACGARLVKVQGTYDDCVDKAIALSKKDNLFLCGDYVLRREGQKTIGWELSGKSFAGVVVAVGNGTVATAVVQGLQEAGETVALVGVQPSTVNPIERAWRTADAIRSMQNTRTIASACNVGAPLDGDLTLAWVKKTGGVMIAVSDEQIRSAQQLLAQTEGLFVEAAAATGLAAVIAESEKYQNQKLVVILTGSGLKES